MLTKDQIFALDDRPKKCVEVPEWNGNVFVRVMSGADRIQVERMIREGEGIVSRAAIVALITVDDKGNRLFTDAADVERLAEKNADALERIAAAGLTFNGITAEAVEAEKND
jgi:hypothetical protein